MFDSPLWWSFRKCLEPWMAESKRTGTYLQRFSKAPPEWTNSRNGSRHRTNLTPKQEVKSEHTGRRKTETGAGRIAVDYQNTEPDVVGAAGAGPRGGVESEYVLPALQKPGRVRVAGSGVYRRGHENRRATTAADGGFIRAGVTRHGHLCVSLLPR